MTQEQKDEILKNLELQFTRTGGPGGQNVNKVNSGVTLRLDFKKLTTFSMSDLERVREKLAGRINDRDELVVQSREERSQLLNRSIGEERVIMLITSALIRPKKRRPTRPGRAARERRLDSKKKQSLKKSLRKKDFS